MKKMLVVVTAIIILGFISTVKAEAWSITWGDWEYYGGLYVENEDDYDEWMVGPTSSPLSNDIAAGGDSGYAYSWMSASPFTIGTETQTDSGDYGCFGDALAGGALYNTFILDGSGEVPTWLTIDLEGSLSGGIYGEGYNEAEVIAALWIAEAGTFPEDLTDLLDFDNGEPEFGEPDWFSEEYLEDFDGTTVIDEHYSELGYPDAGQEYEVLAVLLSGSYSETDASMSEAYANTYFGNSLEFRLTPGDIEPIPEPATMLLFGLGAVGFGALKKRKKNIYG